MRPPPSGIKGLDPAFPGAAGGFAKGLKPPRRRSVADWAEAERYVSAESGSPQPGKWRHDFAPELVEIMECVSLAHPSREVTYKKPAQVGATEVGLNLLGQTAHEAPCPVLVSLQSLDALKEYVKLKLQPMIDATPAVRDVVKEQKSRDEDGSTTFLKKFPGGWISLTTAASSRGLQMKSVRIYIAEEISEYPFDVDGRGDPLGLGDARTAAWEGREKKYRSSTPAIKGACRISKLEAQGDRRRRYMPCPHCGDFQQLHWDRLIKEGRDLGKYPCASCGTLIDERFKDQMRAAGVWLKTYDGPGKPPDVVAPDQVAHFRARGSDGRQPSFASNGLIHPIKAWQTLILAWFRAKGTPSEEKKFFNQDLGEEYEEKGEAPDFEKLAQRREAFAWRIVPTGTVRITGAADVQGDRLKWSVYAWGIGLSCWRIDGSTIIGDPQSETVWRELDQVLERGYADVWGRRWRIDAFGVDTGYLSQRVYAWARRHAAERRVYALDGRPGWKLPPLLRPRRVTVNLIGKAVGKVLLWPVGTWDLKSETYGALRRTIEGPDADGRWPAGAMHFNQSCDDEFFRELTAEHLTERERAGGLVERVWVKDRTTPNEEHDVHVYSRALVHHLTDAWTPDEWVREAARLGQPPEAAQRDLLHWIQPAPAAPAEASSTEMPPAAAMPAPTEPAARAVNEPQHFFRRGVSRSSLMN